MRNRPDRRIRLRRVRFLLAMLSVAIVPLTVAAAMTATPASAAPRITAVTVIHQAAITCRGSGCNYTDPQNTGCKDSRAFALMHETDSYGDLLQLWWSPDCGTNWAQVYSNSDLQHRIWTETQSGLQTARYTFSGYIGWAWSDQLYAPTTNARACEQVYEAPIHQWGPTDCIGQY